MLIRTGSKSSGRNGLQNASSGRELCDEVPRVLHAQVMGAEIPLERRTVADLPPRQAPTAATQRVHTTAHRATGETNPD